MNDERPEISNLRKILALLLTLALGSISVFITPETTDFLFQRFSLEDADRLVLSILIFKFSLFPGFALIGTALLSSQGKRRTFLLSCGLLLVLVYPIGRIALNQRALQSHEARCLAMDQEHKAAGYQFSRAELEKKNSTEAAISLRKIRLFNSELKAVDKTTAQYGDAKIVAFKPLQTAKRLAQTPARSDDDYATRRIFPLRDPRSYLDFSLTLEASELQKYWTASPRVAISTALTMRAFLYRNCSQILRLHRSDDVVFHIITLQRNEDQEITIIEITSATEGLGSLLCVPAIPSEELKKLLESAEFQ